MNPRLIPSTIALFLAISAPGTTQAQNAAAKTYKIANAQRSVPAGVTIRVKAVEVTDDATIVTVVASFDSRVTGSVELNQDNALLLFGSDERLNLRQPTGNPTLKISNGQSMEGRLVFPGVLPGDIERIQLVFNEGRDGGDLAAPGLTIEVQLDKS